MVKSGLEPARTLCLDVHHVLCLPIPSLTSGLQNTRNKLSSINYFAIIENLRDFLTFTSVRCIRDLNPWPPAWQAGVNSSFTNAPKSFFICGPGRDRTYGQRINSPLLYHWASDPFFLFCGPGRDWTYDQRINSPLLYRWATDPINTFRDKFKPFIKYRRHNFISI